MKKFLLLFLLFSFSGIAQTINNYKYVIVPVKFNFLKTENGKKFTFIKDQKVLASESGFDGFYMALLERKA
jgi:hypothetical protein